MKRIIYKLLCCLALLPFASCETQDVVSEPAGTDGLITLSVSTGRADTRALHTEKEYALSHLDVLIFQVGTDDAKSGIAHYQRFTVTDAPEGTVSLSKKRDDFDENNVYRIYVIANSSKAAWGDITDLEKLKALRQEDPMLHLTGLGLEGAPTHFLMDGIAHKEGNTDTDIVLNDGTIGDTKLKVDLVRAAAKVEVVLEAGERVQFFRRNGVGYYLRNLPTVTKVLADGNDLDETVNKQKLVQTINTVSDYSNGKYKGEKYDEKEYDGNGELSIVGYVYSHSWIDNDQESFLKSGTSLIVNIPVVFDVNNDRTFAEAEKVNDSYYQIELGHVNGTVREFLRNYYYKITGTINAPGAEEYSEPIVLQNMKYSAMDWTPVEVEVGGEDKPTYLKVNKDTLRIYNQPTDESLVFASSSPITITVHGQVEEDNNGTLKGSGKPYYFNKYAAKTALDNGKNGYNYWEKNSTNGNEGNGVNINAVSKEPNALSGNIVVNSTIPNNKAIRYFSLLITNEDGNQVEVVVEQYPVIYITNQLGWYSYRSDFGSSYVNKGTRNVSISLSGTGNYNRFKWDGGYEISTEPESGFWYSKVERNQPAYGSNMNIDAYYWHDDNNSKYANTQSANPSGDNARIYHITVTATSGEYTVGLPRMTEPDNAGLSYTDPGADNAKLVSPSFMIASRLGVVTSTGGNLNYVDDSERLTIFRNHCANYVEVVQGKDRKSDIVYDDWRLPTEAELKIIMNYQGANGQDADAIDYLLNGQFYFSASGPVENNNNSTNGTTVRCVRDAY